MLWAVGIVAGVVIAALLVFVFVLQDVETPAYEVVTSDGAFEVREYPALVVAETESQGSRLDGIRQGFRPLAGYIFAHKREGERIAMTAPVTQSIIGQGVAAAGEAMGAAPGVGRWRVRFIMPAEHTLESLPSPVDGRVSLQPLAPARRAAVRFSGAADDAMLAERLGELEAWMAARGERAAGPPEFAYYNDPLTPGFLRRNEIIIDLEPAS